MHSFVDGSFDMHNGMCGGSAVCSISGVHRLVSKRPPLIYQLINVLMLSHIGQNVLMAKIKKRRLEEKRQHEGIKKLHPDTRFYLT